MQVRVKLFVGGTDGASSDERAILDLPLDKVAAGSYRDVVMVGNQ